jgi:hypothetical protein
MRGLYCILILVLVMTACEKDPLPGLIEDEVVVQGIMRQYADTQTVYLSQVVPLGETTSGSAIDNAIVEVIWGDSAYVFEPRTGFLGEYINMDLEVQPNASYQLSIELGDKIIGAHSFAPPSMTVTSSSLSDISVDPENTGNTVLSVEWPHAETHDVLLDLVIALDGSNSLIPYANGNGGYFESIYELPISNDVVHILDYDFTHFGNQRLRFYRIEKEYAYLLRYPHNTLVFNALSFEDNIQNGSGFFTLVTIDQLSFTVSEE